ncbi:hypothetical protein [Pontibacillus salipaludis]|uniref:Uncharacterized protein n=1 Tax=Pontibacillus salipaludis TaxID=1697394 RepID=A0ABQ1QKH4_9BACI|nr:hypothetical protein [Pontibacillus salipaludis]GGD29646.1 hypothetical protein GCM10011389_41500 [Pontibacillus salipaludis]
MKRFVFIAIILFAGIYSLVVFNINSDETIYIKMQDNVEETTSEDNNSNENMTEKLAAEKLFRYLQEEKENQASNGFEVHLEEKEQEEDKYIMKAYSLVGEGESQSKENIGLYSVSKSNGEITSLN